MRWPTFIIVGSIFLGFDEGLTSLMAIHALGGVAPRAVVVLALFISLFGTKQAALWGCWILGFASDMGPRGELITTGLFIPGPASIGLPIFSILIMQVRGSIFRQRPVTFISMTFLGSLIISLMSLIIISARWLAPWIEVGDASNVLLRMGQELAIAFYSALIAVPIGLCMLKLITVWGFPHSGVASR